MFLSYNCQIITFFLNAIFNFQVKILQLCSNAHNTYITFNIKHFICISSESTALAVKLHSRSFLKIIGAWNFTLECLQGAGGVRNRAVGAAVELGAERGQHVRLLRGMRPAQVRKVQGQEPVRAVLGGPIVRKRSRHGRTVCFCCLQRHAQVSIVATYICLMVALSFFFNVICNYFKWLVFLF